MSGAHDPAVVGVVVVAAGSGTRLGAGMPKALVPVGGVPLVVHAVRGALRSARVDEVVVVVPATHRDEFAHLLSEFDVRLVDGGAERTDSVGAGVRALSGAVGTVLVHDAARAFTPPEVFDAVADAVRAGADAVVPGLPVVDTIKQVDVDEQVLGTVDRSTLRAVQTPQGFTRAAIDAAHGSGAQATDDAALVEADGGRVKVVPGHVDAHKVTTPADLRRAEQEFGGAVAPVLVVLGGLPASGKTTIARELATTRGLVHLRVDSIEQAIRESGELQNPMVAGYMVSYAVAADQLDRGLSVVADQVNPVDATRRAWQEVAREHGARLVQVEVSCSDAELHRSRAEARTTGVDGLLQPRWDQIVGRRYEPMTADLHLDTADLEVAECVTKILELIDG